MNDVPLHEPDRAALEGALGPFGISRGNWILIWVVGLLAGIVVYAATVLGSYALLQSAMRTSPLPQLGGFNRTALSNDDAKLIAERFRVASPDAVADKIKNALVSQMTNGANVADLSAFRVLAGLLIGTARCASDCSPDCIAMIEGKVLRALGGWPSTQIEPLNLPTLAKQSDAAGPVLDLNAACDQVRKDAQRAMSFTELLLSPIGLIDRRSPVPIPRLAEDLLGPGSCESSSPTRNTCQLLVRTMQAIVDSETVRFRRSLMVNLFYGWERLIVWVLVFATLGTLVARAWLYGPVARRAFKIQPILRNDVRHSSDEALNEAISNDREARKETKPDKKRRDALAELLDAAGQDLGKGATERNVEKIATLNVEEIESERLSIESMIAIFPVVGFVATLLGLIEALSSANTIATTAGDERSAAILNVTTVLSSCFATTFLALVFMAMFSVVNMVQGRKEKSIFRTIELLLTRLISSHRDSQLRDDAQRDAERERAEEERAQLELTVLEREAMLAQVHAAVALKKSEDLHRQAEAGRERLKQSGRPLPGSVAAPRVGAIENTP